MSKRNSADRRCDFRKFDPNADYESTLFNMYLEFTERWNNVPVSPATGLDGFDVMAVIGKGSFADVKLVKDRTSGAMFAVKVFRKEQLKVVKRTREMLNTKRVQYAVRFPFLLSLEFARKDNDNIYLGLPLVNGNHLYEYHRRVHRFPERHAQFYAAQIFLALEYMHFMQLLYRDLKPENIVIDHNGYIKIIDFNSTIRVGCRITTFCGTPEYLPPEIIQGHQYDTSVDWWAFGVLLYEFVAGYTPFALFKDNTILMYTKICQGDFKIPGFFTKHLNSLICSLLEVDASKR